LARQEFHMKNYKEAQFHLKRAQSLAERAEYTALSKGNIREAAPPDPHADQRFLSREEPDFVPVETEYEPVDERSYADEMIRNQQQARPNTQR